MKTIFKLFLFVVFGMQLSQISAQICPDLIRNGALDWTGNPNQWQNAGGTFGTAQIDLDAFTEGSVTNWYAVNASPDVFDALGLGGSFDCARMGANPAQANAWEGIGQTLGTPLVAGQTYLVRLQVFQNINTP